MSLRPAMVPVGIRYHYDFSAPIDLKVVSWGKGNLTDQRSYTYIVPNRKDTYIYVMDEGLDPSYFVGNILSYFYLIPFVLPLKPTPGLLANAQG